MPIQWDQIGPGIRDRRQDAELTQAALAAAVGVSWNTIARLETGARRPSLDLLDRLAGVFGCGVADLLPERPTGRTARPARKRPHRR